MKKILCNVLLFLLVGFLCGCNSFEIQGINNFTEYDCCFGLNDRLLPENRTFLSNYTYDEGSYHYWRNNYGQAKAKTFVRLQYSEIIYHQAKSACQDYYNFSTTQYNYEDFVFYAINIADGDVRIDFKYPGLRMLGYNDNTCTLIFIGYLNDNAMDNDNQITTSNFLDFFNDQFGEYILDENTMLTI